MRVIPRAKRNEIEGERGGVLLVRVTAPPVEGKANTAVCELIASSAGVARGRVAVVRGAGTRDKVVRVAGVSERALRRSLGLG